MNENQAHARLQYSKSKRHAAPALGTAISRETKGVPRAVVRFIGHRCRPLDPDNFAGGCKDLLDGLRHADLLEGDEPWQIHFQTTQEKVDHRWQEKTVIELEIEEKS